MAKTPQKTEDTKIIKGERAQELYEQIKADGRLLYECVVGSQSYGTALPTSDVDKKFIYIETLDNILTGNDTCQLSITDDYVGYELGRYLELLAKQNPNIIELLHADEQFVEFCHPMFRELVVNRRDLFLSNKVAFSFGSYAKTQIDKAQGTNKKFMNPMDGPRKSLFEFAWIPYKNGSMSLKQYMEDMYIPAEWIGLSGIDHMKYTYHMFLDPSYKSVMNECREYAKKHRPLWKKFLMINFSNKEKLRYVRNFKARVDEVKQACVSIFNGPVDIDGVQPKMSSIPKNLKPVTVVQFNLDGFQKYCDDYKEYHEWLKNRNMQRFVENASNENNFDRKNMMHCHRLLDMCIEILSGQGVNVLRPNREELLSIRLGENTYQTLVDAANVKMEKITELHKTSTLQDTCDPSLVATISLEMRKSFYGI